MKQPPLVSALTPGPPSRLPTCQSRAGERHLALLTDRVCRLMAPGRNTGLEWMATRRHLSPVASLAYKKKDIIWTAFPGCAEDPPAGFRHRKRRSSYHYISRLTSRLKVKIGGPVVHLCFLMKLFCGVWALTLTCRCHQKQLLCTYQQHNKVNSRIKIHPPEGRRANPAGDFIYHSLERGTKFIQLFQGGSISPSLKPNPQLLCQTLTHNVGCAVGVLGH